MNSEKEEGKDEAKNQMRGSPNKPPAPPISHRPAPPISRRPAPPKKANQNTSDIDPSLSNHEDSNQSTRRRALDLEQNGDYSEAAILFRSLGLANDENRCLQLALSKSQSEKTTIVHNGDKIIRDSVIMSDDD